MPIPKKLSRKTKHAKPRCQLYQPGFNPINGCWLNGAWITVPSDGFRGRAKAHEALYAGIRKQLKKQHYRDPGVAPADMTPGQRQAWEHFSGEGRLEVRYPNGHIGTIGTTLAADVPTEKTLKWMRETEVKVIPRVIGPNKEIEDQTAGIPQDLLADDKEPVDFWKHIVTQNRDRARDMSLAMLEVEPGTPHSDFAVGIAMHGLTELEESTIRMELSEDPDLYETPEEVRQRYVDLRTQMAEKMGDSFGPAYLAARASHNECARINLDNSEGMLYCYVLPEFRADGTHEPIGPRDFPWGQKAEAS